MKKRKRGVSPPRPPRPKSQPSVVTQFQAAMRAEEDSEHCRAVVINTILGKIARTFPPPPDGLSVVSIDINFENVLEIHECIRCHSKSKGIGCIRVGHDTVCVYPICARCGKMASVSSPVSEEIERIVYKILEIDR